ncbi:MAG TPA: hypothetical protein PKK37_01345 [Candidatus Pacearchaeota archaeon]|jgi:Kef-type K+ transport system membrane component KefB|nr:hypothetical protein [Candidatus Pacearchaeota archaeon]
MADLSNFGNGLMGAFLFLMIGTGALLTLTAENWDWYQPIILQIVHLLGGDWIFVGVMMVIGFIIGWIMQELSPPL